MIHFLLDKFIAFKTFLDEKFDAEVPDENRFQFPMLNAYLKANKVCLQFTLSSRILLCLKRKPTIKETIKDN